MRKIISVLALGSLLAILLLPMVVSAQAQECCSIKRDITYEGVTYTAGDVVGPTGGVCDVAITKTTDDWGTICLLNSLNRIFDWVFVIIMAVVGIMVVIGAFSIITAGGSPEKVTTGRNYILYAIIGMVVAAFARAIPAIVASLIK